MVSSGRPLIPNFFKEAIVGKADYDDQMRELAQQGKNGDEIYEVLTTTDVRDACDLFAPVYQRTNAHDGYVSIEVSPTLAHDERAHDRRGEAALEDGRSPERDG